jgi:hypothetical protein
MTTDSYVPLNVTGKITPARESPITRRNPLQPRVAMIIVNWNGKDDTIECLKSLRKITYRNHDIVVVDNGSTDDSVKQLKKNHPEATIIETGENLGLAEGNNVGMRYALKKWKPKYLMVLNNDIEVKPDFLDALVNAMEAHPEVAISAPKIYYYYGNRKTIWTVGIKLTWKGNKHIGLNEIDHGQYDKQMYVDILHCVMLMRSKALKETKLVPKGRHWKPWAGQRILDQYFDGRMFIMWEELELCLRAARRRGYKCLYVPDAMIWHKCSRSTHRDYVPGTVKCRYYDRRNWLVMIRDNFGIPAFLGAAIVHIGLFVFYGLANLLLTKRLDLVRPNFQGILDGILYRMRKWSDA